MTPGTRHYLVSAVRSFLRRGAAALGKTYPYSIKGGPSSLFPSTSEKRSPPGWNEISNHDDRICLADSWLSFATRNESTAKAEEGREGPGREDRGEERGVGANAEKAEARSGGSHPLVALRFEFRTRDHLGLICRTETLRFFLARIPLALASPLLGRSFSLRTTDHPREPWVPSCSPVYTSFYSSRGLSPSCVALTNTLPMIYSLRVLERENCLFFPSLACPLSPSSPRSSSSLSLCPSPTSISWLGSSAGLG